MTILTNRLHTRAKIARLTKSGRELTPYEKEKFGKSAMLRYLASCGEPIYLIGYVKHKNPMAQPRGICNYTEKGREKIHKNLQVNTGLLYKLIKQPLGDRSIEYTDSRISLFSAQQGKCAITGEILNNTDEIHCHHKIPKELGGKDEYQNLILILESVHQLVHATEKDTIEKYKTILNLTNAQLENVNSLRVSAGLGKINLKK